MVASLLAILKTGGAYLPLDPGYPAQRLRFMLADAAVKIVLTQEKFSPLVAVSTKMLFVDQSASGISPPAKNFKSDARADSRAYVIYTSGSTGTPKGVVGVTSGAVSRFSWMWKTFPFSPDEAVKKLRSASSTRSGKFLALCFGEFQRCSCPTQQPRSRRRWLITWLGVG